MALVSDIFLLHANLTSPSAFIKQIQKKLIIEIWEKPPLTNLRMYDMLAITKTITINIMLATMTRKFLSTFME